MCTVRQGCRHCEGIVTTDVSYGCTHCAAIYIYSYGAISFCCTGYSWCIITSQCLSGSDRWHCWYLGIDGDIQRSTWCAYVTHGIGSSSGERMCTVRQGCRHCEGIVATDVSYGCTHCATIYIDSYGAVSFRCTSYSWCVITC
jgi:hypothetical protein